MLEKETKEVLKNVCLLPLAGRFTYIWILTIKNGISFLSSTYKFGALYRSSCLTTVKLFRCKCAMASNIWRPVDFEDDQAHSTRVQEGICQLIVIYMVT